MAESNVAPSFETLSFANPDEEHQLNEFEIAFLQHPAEFGEAITMMRVLGIEAVGRVLSVVAQSPEHLEAVAKAHEIFSEGIDKGVVAFDPVTEAQIDTDPKLQALIDNHQMDPEVRSTRIRHHRFEIFAKRVAAWRAGTEQPDTTLKQTA